MMQEISAAVITHGNFIGNRIQKSSWSRGSASRLWIQTNLSLNPGSVNYHICDYRQFIRPFKASGVSFEKRMIPTWRLVVIISEIIYLWEFSLLSWKWSITLPRSIWIVIVDSLILEVLWIFSIRRLYQEFSNQHVKGKILKFVSLWGEGIA